MVIVGAGCIGQGKLRILLAKLLSHLFKVFTLFFVPGKLGADVLSGAGAGAAISTTPGRTHGCYASLCIPVARILILLIVHYFLGVEWGSWALRICLISYAEG